VKPDAEGENGVRNREPRPIHDSTKKIVRRLVGAFISIIRDALYELRGEK
jgi:hypothetical protein